MKFSDLHRTSPLLIVNTKYAERTGILDKQYHSPENIHYTRLDKLEFIICHMLKTSE